MSSIDDVLATIPMDRLAAQLGVDEETAEQAARTALPALFGGMEGGVDLGQVDTADGDKIVGHIFGAQREPVVNRLGGSGKGGGFDIGDVLGGLLGGRR